jgi:hypothetical protein
LTAVNTPATDSAHDARDPILRVTNGAMMSARRSVLALAMLFAAAASTAMADEGVPALTDEGCRQLAAALERYLAQREAVAAEGLRDVARAQARAEGLVREIEDIGAGRADALAALKKRSKRVAAAPGARYAPKCSAMFTAHTLEPTVIYTFGKALRARGPGADLRNDPLDVDAASLAEWERIRDAAVAFFETKGFARIEVDNAPASLVWMEPRAEPRDLTVVVCANWNCGTAAFDDLKRACGELPNGPALRLKPRQESGEAAAAEPAAGPVGPLGDRMGELLSAANQARQDLRAPEELRALEEAARSVPEESIRAFARTRRRNAEVYARHAARLDPLVERAIGQ